MSGAGDGAAPSVQRLAARSSLLDGSTRIWRALPNRARRTVGAWCFLDHVGPVQFGAGQGMHVGPHPHIGLQTFTWMIEGEVLHLDSLGNEQIIRPGQVNLMTSGAGIVHSEDSVGDGARLHLAQLWIALPEQARHGAADFKHYAELPVVNRSGLRVTVLVGQVSGVTSPVSVHSPLVGLDLWAEVAVDSALPLEIGFEHAVLVLRGQARVAGEVVQPGTLLYLERGRRALVVQCQEQTQLLLLGGEPFDEKPLMWWNFVGRRPDEIERARADWVDGSARFAPVPGARQAPVAAPALAGARLRP